MPADQPTPQRPPDRPDADRCPGMLKPFPAEDGLIARIRIPGGRIAVSLVRGLLDAVRDEGATELQLTSRGNLQVRGLPDPLPESLTGFVERHGLIPSVTHERARNVLATPGSPELEALARELDEALCATPLLAALPGRFLFGLTGERGEILHEPVDLAWQQTGPGSGRLLAAGVWERPAARAEAVDLLIEQAVAFLDHRPDERTWNVRDLPADSPWFTGWNRGEAPAAEPLEPGPQGADLVAGVPLGLLTREHLAALAEVAETITITPWRSVFVPGGAAYAETLALAGLVVDPEAPWAGISACTGAPGCARTDSPTQPLARAYAARLAELGAPRPRPSVHIVGCERHCGARPDDRLVVDPRQLDDILEEVLP